MEWKKSFPRNAKEAYFWCAEWDVCAKKWHVYIARFDTDDTEGWYEIVGIKGRWRADDISYHIEINKPAEHPQKVTA